jgi:hypothetical protein
VEVKPSAYLDQLERAIDEDRAAHGKRPLKEKPDHGQAAAQTKEVAWFWLEWDRDAPSGSNRNTFCDGRHIQGLPLENNLQL